MTRSVDKRYFREMAIAMGAYMLVMLLVWPMVRRLEPGVPLVAVALLPLLPFAAALRAMIRHVRDSDEFQRKIQLEALAVSAAIVSFASMAGGFLAAARVIELDGTILLWVFPALAMLFGLVRCGVARRYAHG